MVAVKTRPRAKIRPKSPIWTPDDDHVRAVDFDYGQEDNDVIWTPNEERMLRHLMLNDPLAYARYFFNVRDSMEFVVNPHHIIMADTLQKVVDGEITRLIINVPPGYTKTELAVIFFMSRGLAINPGAKFIHTTYSDELALENSQKTKDIVESPEFQKLFRARIRMDSNSKKKWYTKRNGGVYATASGGPITGFRAGKFQKGFQGAFIIDDAIKPDDAFSETVRNKINNRFMNTFMSRLAVKKRTPMILIMQRIHEDDPTGYLLQGGTGEKWHHLLLPSPIPPGNILDWYPKEYTHGIPIEYDLPEGALWTFKHDDADMDEMDKADPYTTASQYHQSPSPKGGAIFKDEMWKYWAVMPRDLAFIKIFADTAEKTGEENDYTVMQAWGYSPSLGILLIDQAREKVEAPELERMMLEFWNKTVGFAKIHNVGVVELVVEEKSSGTSLVQNITRNTNIPIRGIFRAKDKVTRAYGAVPQVNVGNVWIPIDAEWVFEYKAEHRKFSPMMSHKNDDQIDPTIDAIHDMLMNVMILPSGGETIKSEQPDDDDSNSGTSPLALLSGAA